MSDGLSESAIVSAVAQEASRLITRKVIRELQNMKHTLSGDDSELKTTWDEICAQIQYEQSFFWDSYDEIVRSHLKGYVNELPSLTQDAIWLQTDAGSDWWCEDPDDRDTFPVCDDDSVDYLAREYVYAEAGRWSNTRIRTFIEQSCMRD